MTLVRSPSDLNMSITPNYTNGIGYYTTAQAVANTMLIGTISASTSPSLAQLGGIIREVEAAIDQTCHTSWRPLVYEDEFHDFAVDWSFAATFWGQDYIQVTHLRHTPVAKILRLSILEGESWRELASSVATITLSDPTTITSITLTAPNSFDTWTLTAGNDGTSTKWNNQLGTVSAAKELVALINGAIPHETGDFTGAIGPKSLTGTNSHLCHKFFYAWQEGNVVYISSLLPDDAGTDCSISISQTGSDNSVGNFAGHDGRGRGDKWWTHDGSGAIFFKSDFPFYTRHSMRVAYVSGHRSVPGTISEAASKMAAIEVAYTEDETFMIGGGETGLPLSTKVERWDKEAKELLALHTELVYYKG